METRKWRECPSSSLTFKRSRSPEPNIPVALCVHVNWLEIYQPDYTHMEHSKSLVALIWQLKLHYDLKNEVKVTKM